MKIVCEGDCLEDNEPIIYGPYAQRDCLDHNEFAGNKDEERERAICSFPDAAGWWYPASMHKREWNSRVRSRRETGMSGTSSTTRLTVTHFRERTKITVLLLKPFPRREREKKKKETAMTLYFRRVARSADKLIEKCVISFCLYI